MKKFRPQQFSGLHAKHSEGNAEDILGQTDIYLADRCPLADSIRIFFLGS